MSVLDLDRLTGRERGGKGRRGLNLAGVDLTSRRTRAQRGGDPAAEAPASERDEDGVGLRQVLEDLEPDGAVSRHHGAVRNGMDERSRNSLASVITQRLPPLVIRDLHDRRTEPRYGLQLRLWRIIGHHDGAGDTQIARAPGDALGHVSRTRGIHARRQRIGRQRSHRVHRAANLE